MLTYVLVFLVLFLFAAILYFTAGTVRVVAEQSSENIDNGGNYYYSYYDVL